MKKTFLCIALVGLALALIIMTGALALFGATDGLLVVLIASQFLIAALWPERQPRRIGSGEISGLPFEAFDNGTVTLTHPTSRETHFASFEMMERVLFDQELTNGGSGEPPPVMFEGWGRRS